MTPHKSITISLYVCGNVVLSLDDELWLRSQYASYYHLIRYFEMCLGVHKLIIEGLRAPK